MEEIISELEAWLQERPKWLQKAALILSEKGKVPPDDLSELVLNCKAEANYPGLSAHLPAGTFPSGTLSASRSSNVIQLKSISGISGINALAPRTPLLFNGNAVTVVYGGNGSGKSGYVRILKKICGAKYIDELYGNVFSNNACVQECTIGYTVDGDAYSYAWCDEAEDDPLLKQVDIFDGECGNVYLTKEGELTCEPQLLLFLTRLAEVCDEVGGEIEAEIKTSKSGLPTMSEDFKGAGAYKWLKSLSHTTSTVEIVQKASWDVERQKELEDCQKRLAESDPAEKAKALGRKLGNLQAFIARIEASTSAFSDDKCREVTSANMDLTIKRRAALEDAKRVFSGTALTGVGTESWKLLWESARKFSDTEAYKGKLFPYVGDGARCVLCHQPLNPDAVARLNGFEAFVIGDLERQAKNAENAVANLLEDFDVPPNVDDAKLVIDALELPDDSIQTSISSLLGSITARKEFISKASSAEDLPPLADVDAVEKLRAVEKKLNMMVKQLQTDALIGQRDKTKEALKELQAAKFLADNRAAIEQEVERLKLLATLEEAKRLTNTMVISRKKSAIAGNLITEEYIRRFQDELDALGASHFRVRIVKSGTTKGHVLHKVTLDGLGQDVPVAKVLSEGEYRVLSIASFLADVAAREARSPFVFDDPISSLDQDFEEAVARRLLDLAQSRQVIVFTHRLSLVAFLKDEADRRKTEMSILTLQKMSWGMGEPVPRFLYTENPLSALNILLNEQIPKAKKALDSSWEEYEPRAQSICTEIRKTIERVVEKSLLQDVVARFRRSVETKNKLKQLSKIKVDDLTMIDSLMTKYSKYEHSQSTETPVSTPDPHELEEDVGRLVAWMKEFDKRPILC